MICFPNAKINLGLNIVSKRDDGFHNISSCFIPIPLYDALEIRRSKNFTINFYGSKGDIDLQNNTITKAWQIINREFKTLEPVEVNVYKNIPIASGLGGGSSNASFFLDLINRYQGLNISTKQLMNISAEVGADCPFFFINKPSMVSGIGEIINPVNLQLAGIHLAIIYPNIKLSTKTAFEEITPSGKIISEKSLAIPNLRTNNISNDFEKIVFKKYPYLSKIKAELYNSGAFYASLTGSGSSIYALSKKELILNNDLNNYKNFKSIF